MPAARNVHQRKRQFEALRAYSESIGILSVCIESRQVCECTGRSKKCPWIGADTMCGDSNCFLYRRHRPDFRICRAEGRGLFVEGLNLEPMTAETGCRKVHLLGRQSRRCHRRPRQRPLARTAISWRNLWRLAAVCDELPNPDWQMECQGYVVRYPALAMARNFLLTPPDTSDRSAFTTLARVECPPGGNECKEESN